MLAIPWGIVASLWKRKFKNGLNELSVWFYAWAISIDQLGNVVCKELFNDTLILHTGIPFGNPDETISSVLGKNKKANTLSKGGKGLDWILNKLDPNHSINSIEIDE
ncbi:NUDIX hydrolase [Formosa sp. Hel1_33_131]|nr:NUDIX hydrolase [Formosa sp. Hel1_33_131]